MERTGGMPIWVYLAFSSITTRKGAIWLILSSIIFTLYCVPWSLLVTNPDWVATLFLIDDWSWVAMMVPVMLWYLISLNWVDRNLGWDAVAKDESESDTQ